jgi:RNA polymerase primary sigma factor
VQNACLYAGMERLQFFELFTNNETNFNWLKEATLDKKIADALRFLTS